MIYTCARLPNLLNKFELDVIQASISCLRQQPILESLSQIETHEQQTRSLAHDLVWKARVWPCNQCRSQVSSSIRRARQNAARPTLLLGHENGQISTLLPQHTGSDLLTHYEKEWQDRRRPVPSREDRMEGTNLLSEHSQVHRDRVLVLVSQISLCFGAYFELHTGPYMPLKQAVSRAPETESHSHQHDSELPVYCL